MWRAFLVAVLCCSRPRLASAEDCPTTSVGYRVVHFGHRVVAVWYPTTAPASLYSYSPRFSGMVALDAPPGTACHTPVPLVVFSHGFTGCGMQSIALTEELARHGYVVAAPDHADALFCHIDPEAAGPPSRLERPSFSRAETWSDATFADRRADIEATIDGLLADKDFRDVIDAQKIGAMGHSLGGYTVVGMAGGWASWRDPRIRAVLALSPYVRPFEVHHTLQGIRVPLMYQGRHARSRHYSVFAGRQRSLSSGQSAGILRRAEKRRAFRLGQLRRRAHGRSRARQPSPISASSTNTGSRFSTRISNTRPSRFSKKRTPRSPLTISS